MSDLNKLNRALDILIKHYNNIEKDYIKKYFTVCKSLNIKLTDFSESFRSQFSKVENKLIKGFYVSIFYYNDDTETVAVYMYQKRNGNMQVISLTKIINSI